MQTVSPPRRAAPVANKPTTYRGLNDMAAWWEWSIEVEEHSVGTFRPFVKPGDLVFDIGANRGRKTYILRKLGARVIAVDPLFAFGSEFVPEFAWKFGADRNVVTVPKAVCVGRETEISINKFMPYVSSIDKAWMTESTHAAKFGEPYYAPQSLIKRKVGCITLDGLVSIYGMPAFMKVDVEGHENAALKTLSVPVRALNMEFHQDWMPLEAMAHLDAMGPYQWTYALDNQGTFATEWTGREHLLAIMARKLTKSGQGSWGDIYGRLID